MSDPPSIGSDRNLLDLAIERDWLDAETGARLTAQAAENGTELSDLLIEEGLLNTGRVDALKALLEPTSVAPGFEVLELLGQGAFGCVYLARQGKLDRIVALKVINLQRFGDSNIGRRTEVEAQVVGGLKHPNIVAAFDYGTHRGQMYLAMEFVEGNDLLDHIQSVGPCNERFAWGIARQVASALAYANDAGIVHRDIKPANILLTEPPPGFATQPGLPMVKVTDFGLARRAFENADGKITMPGTTVGTPYYVAPEQLGRSEVDTRADIYALGATVFHLLTGEAPYAELNSVMTVILAKTRGERWASELPAGVSDATRQLLDRMMAHEPADRLPTCRMLVEEIDRLLTTSPSADPAPTQAIDGGQADAGQATQVIETVPTEETRHQTFSGRRIWIAIATALTLIAGVGIGALFLPEKDGDTSSNNDEDSTPVERELVYDGWQKSLFDGENVPLDAEQNGSWDVPPLSTGGSFLVGSNGASLKFTIEPPMDKPLNYFDVRMRITPVESASAEVHFGLADSEARFGLRIAGKMAKVGRPDRNRLAPIPNGRSIELREPNRNVSMGRVVRIIRQPDGWFVYVNGTPVAALPAESRSGDPVITIIAGDGNVKYSDMDVRRLRVVEEK